MNLGFSLNFPWHEPTYFPERIMNPQGFVGPNDEWDDQPVKKIHTFRHGNRWSKGKAIHMATGIRTKEYKRFNSDLFNICISTQHIIIEREYGMPYPTIIIDGHRIEQSFHKQIAMNDGFPSLEKFYKWFSKGFDGQIVHWTTFKY